jgi:hypothetical protein
VSGAIRIAKGQYRGDPGIFGSIGKLIGGVAKVAGNFLPGPLGMVAKGVAALAGNGKPVNPSVAKAAPLSISQAGFFPQQPDSTVTRGVSLFPGGPMVGTQVNHYGGNTTQGGTAAAHPHGACAPGYHTNKSGYYTRNGYVAPGTKCVRNRKRNPLNPRALSRSMARISSAKKAARFLGAVSIREKGRGCGCK